MITTAIDRPKCGAPLQPGANQPIFQDEIKVYVRDAGLSKAQPGAAPHVKLRSHNPPELICLKAA